MDSAGLSGGLTINDGAATTYRLFTVNASATVALRSLTLANGGGAGFNTFGGAFRNSGRLMLTQCTLTGNSANSGGAIRNDGTLTLTQCTLTGNTATVRGGAIENNLGLTTLTHCTVTGNTAPAGAGSGVTSIGSGNGETVVENTIIAGNTNSDVDYVLGANNTFTPRGANIIGTGNATGDFIAVGDLIGFNAASLKLAPLGNYGGTTQTMALQPGNYAANSAAMLRPAILSDQRGFPIVSQPDIGAYEAGTFTNYNAFIYEKLPSTATTPQHATTFDFDGDGATNTQEWAALTDPASAASVFRATATRSGGNLIITFPTVAGKTYTLWQSNTLGSWTNTGQIALSGNGSPRTFTVTAPVAGFPKRFYRVEVGP